MKRYIVRYKWQGDELTATLAVTRWGRIARWLHLTDRHRAKFTEAPND